MKYKTSTQQLTLLGMFAALIAIFSQLSIPLPTGVPVTLQTFALALAGYILGAKLGTGTALLWLLLGIVNIPVYSNFGSGIGKFFGYTGGFLIGLPFLTLLCGLGRLQKKHWGILFGIAGLVILHALGTLGYARVAHVSITAAALAVSVPYLIKDVISIVIAWILGKEIYKRLRAASIL